MALNLSFITWINAFNSSIFNIKHKATYTTKARAIDINTEKSKPKLYEVSRLYINLLVKNATNAIIIDAKNIFKDEIKISFPPNLPIFLLSSKYKIKKFIVMTSE